MDTIATYVNRYQTQQAERERAAREKQERRVSGLIARLEADVKVWLPDDILSALAPSAAYVAGKGEPVTVQMDVTYKGEVGHIRLTQYSDQSGADPALSFGSSGNYSIKMRVSVKGNGPDTVRQITPAGADELGELFYMLDKRQASERAMEKMKEAGHAWQAIYNLGSEAEMREWYATVYLPAYGTIAANADSLERVISDRKAYERADAEQAARVAEQDKEDQAYRAHKAAVQAEADSIWHPFTVYRIEYGAVVSDEDGSAGPALDNVYCLDAAPDAEGWYRRVNGGRVTRVRIPGAVLVEELKVETPEQARYLPVCKVWHRDGVAFMLPPDTVLVGADAGELETAGVDEENIPF